MVFCGVGMVVAVFLTLIQVVLVVVVYICECGGEKLMGNTRINFKGV